MKKTESEHHKQALIGHHLRMQQITILILFLFILSPSVSAKERAGPAVVIDGDSLEVDGRNIRLWGIDAPEYRQTCTRDGKSWKCGAAAKRALRNKISKASLRCQILDTDRYAREVCTCTVRGLSLNAWMVEQGWALDYSRYSKGRFATEEAAARNAQRGIWSGSFGNPEQWRRDNPWTQKPR